MLHILMQHGKNTTDSCSNGNNILFVVFIIALRIDLSFLYWPVHFAECNCSLLFIALVSHFLLVPVFAVLTKFLSLLHSATLLPARDLSLYPDRQWSFLSTSMHWWLQAHYFFDGDGVLQPDVWNGVVDWIDWRTEEDFIKSSATLFLVVAFLICHCEY